MVNQEGYENFMKGLALFRYLDTHKPSGEDVDGFTRDIEQYLSLLSSHYEYCINKLLESKEKLVAHKVKGWYQKKKKKSLMRVINSQIKDFEGEMVSINEMMANL